LNPGIDADLIISTCNLILLLATFFATFGWHAVISAAIEIGGKISFFQG